MKREWLAMGVGAVGLLAGACASELLGGGEPERLRRADSFFGIHFDFHAREDCTAVGSNTTPGMVAAIIGQVKPDYIQIDCKGHPGFSSYPTKVGNPVPGFVGDPLRVWRQATAARGVALYMHYSGVWDGAQVAKHSDWAAAGADGKPSAKATSVFGPYADRLLIPQLRELAGAYGVDGAWIDGECWATVPDYGEQAAKAFRDATGGQTLPKKPGDPHWFEFQQFHREAFRQYLRHYVSEVHKTNPDFQLCSNWAFTDHMAEPVSAPVDFLSGDYAPDDSVNSARLSARFLQRQGMPWDLMAWSFSRKAKGPDGKGLQKSVQQLAREAAVVVALGGGFQAYFTQRRDGSVKLEQMPAMAETARFCRERQALCHRAVPVPQVALLLSTEAHYRKVNGLFNRDYAGLGGVLQALLESQRSVEVVAEHQLKGRLGEYPLIVVPEWGYLDPAFRDELAAYAKAGGSLLLVGPKSAALFQKELSVSLAGEPSGQALSLAWEGGEAKTKGLAQAVKLGAGAEAFGTLRADGGAAQPAASVATLGKGVIAAVYAELGQSYGGARSPVVRGFLDALARRLFPKPTVEVSGSSDVDVCLMRKEGRLLVNLVNTSGPHQTAPIQETIQPVGPLAVTLRLPARPKRLTLEPGGQRLAFAWRDGEARLTVPALDIHRVITLE
jgi:hypothetical protein